MKIVALETIFDLLFYLGLTIQTFKNKVIQLNYKPKWSSNVPVKVDNTLLQHFEIKQFN